MKEEKTNVMRLLDGKKIPYVILNYTQSGAISGTDAADALKLPYERVFKTLVTVGKTPRTRFEKSSSRGRRKKRFYA